MKRTRAEREEAMLAAMCNRLAGLLRSWYIVRPKQRELIWDELGRVAVRYLEVREHRMVTVTEE